MSDRARDFLNDWLFGHIKPLQPHKRVAVSVRLADQCRKDATVSGIPLQEIRDEVGGDLIRAILHVLDSVAADLHDQIARVPQTSDLVEG